MDNQLMLPNLWPSNEPNPLEWLLEQHEHITDVYEMQGYDCVRPTAEHKHFGNMLKSMAAILELQILDHNPQFEDAWASVLSEGE